jgi:hypothetical protein
LRKDGGINNRHHNHSHRKRGNGGISIGLERQISSRWEQCCLVLCNDH